MNSTEMTCNAATNLAQRNLDAAGVSHELGDNPRASMSETAIKSASWGGPRANSGGSRSGAGRKSAPVIAPRTDTYPHWCVVKTNHRAERLAAHELARAGYRAYLPMEAMHRRDPVTPTMIHRVVTPLFPGYLLLELTDPTYAPVNALPGVETVLLGHNGKPWRVSESMVERLQAADNTRLGIKLTAEPVYAMPAFTPGDRVTITTGALSGHAGGVLHCDGLSTLVEINVFGRPTSTQIDRSALVAAL